MYVYVYVRVWCICVGGMCTHVCRCQMRTSDVYHSMLYFPNTETLGEPEASLVVTKPQ